MGLHLVRKPAIWYPLKISTPKLAEYLLAGAEICNRSYKSNLKWKYAWGSRGGREKKQGLEEWLVLVGLE